MLIHTFVRSMMVPYKKEPTPQRTSQQNVIYNNHLETETLLHLYLLYPLKVKNYLHSQSKYLICLAPKSPNLGSRKSVQEKFSGTFEFSAQITTTSNENQANENAAK